MFKQLSYQGNPGSYAHLAIAAHYPQATATPCPTFADAFAMAENGHTDAAVIPVENSTMGRVADIHDLLPTTTLHIIAEHYLPIEHCLLAKPGVTLAELTKVYSQVPALTQCRHTLQHLGLEPHAAADTAGAAKMVAAREERTAAALASALAGEIYGLEVLKPRMNDAAHNTTRFITLARTPQPPALNTPSKTSLLFTVKSIPAALYKALGSFANNGINLTKLESYLLNGDFVAAQFYVEIDGHTEAPNLQQALKELATYTENIKMLGCYAQNPLKAA